MTALSSASGGVAATYTYESFGAVTEKTGNVSNRLQYTAREFVPKAGLYYYRARYYDPATGRFQSEASSADLRTSGPW